MAMHWRRVGDTRRRRWQIGMPKAQTGATLFESGDGVWIHLMGEPTKSPLFSEAIAEVRPDGPAATTSDHVVPDMLDGWPEALLLRPSGEWLGVVLGQRRARAARAAARARSSSDEQARANGYVVELDHPELGAHHRWPARRSRSRRRPACATLAPELGAHTDEVLDGVDSRASATAPAAGAPRPSSAGRSKA